KLQANNRMIYGGRRLFNTTGSTSEIRNLQYHGVYYGNQANAYTLGNQAAVALTHKGKIIKANVSGNYFLDGANILAGGVVLTVDSGAIVHHAKFEGIISNNKQGGVAHTNRGEIKWSRSQHDAVTVANGGEIEMGGI